MEIISTSYINDKEYENCINIKDNLINSIIDYGNIKYLIINNKKYILLDDIKKSFKANTLEKEIEYYKKYINEELIKNTVKLFDLQEEFYKKNINTMCSSEIRLAYIFLNILFNEKLIILDDITESLDFNNTKKIIHILKELKRQNKTIIIISNDVEFVHKVSDNIIVLDYEKLYEGDKYDVFVNGNLKQIPYVIEFSKKVKNKKNIKIGYRDDIKDLMKDIYRYVK